MNNQTVPQASITKGQLAESLGMSLRTLQRKLKEKKVLVPRGLISYDLVVFIKKKLGYKGL